MTSTRQLVAVAVSRLVRFYSFFGALARFLVLGRVRLLATANVGAINFLCALGGKFEVIGGRSKTIVEVRRTSPLLLVLQPKNVVRHILKARSVPT